MNWEGGRMNPIPFILPPSSFILHPSEEYMAHYDVIVVGAGPAGNAAAFDLARGGAKVALLEKQTLPRHKTCGGGMPMMVSQVLALEEIRDLAPDAFVEADTQFMRHTWNFDDPVLVPMNPDEEDPRRLSHKLGDGFDK